MKLIPIREFKWSATDFSNMYSLTCKNHQSARYLTKNPFSRGIHTTKLPEGDIPRSHTGECTCPLADLVVMVDEFTPMTYSIISKTGLHYRDCRDINEAFRLVRSYSLDYYVQRADGKVFDRIGNECLFINGMWT